MPLRFVRDNATFVCTIICHVSVSSIATPRRKISVCLSRQVQAKQYRVGWCTQFYLRNIHSLLRALPEVIAPKPRSRSFNVRTNCARIEQLQCCCVTRNQDLSCTSLGASSMPAGHSVSAVRTKLGFSSNRHARRLDHSTLPL